MEEERGGMNAFRTQHPSIAAIVAATAVVAASENFMSLSPIGASFLFARDALHFYDETKATGLFDETFEMFARGIRTRMRGSVVSSRSTVFG